MQFIIIFLIFKKRDEVKEPEQERGRELPSRSKAIKGKKHIQF